jgi:hypothetical protein
MPVRRAVGVTLLLMILTGCAETSPPRGGDRAQESGKPAGPVRAEPAQIFNDVQSP